MINTEAQLASRAGHQEGRCKGGNGWNDEASTEVCFKILLHRLKFLETHLVKGRMPSVSGAIGSGFESYPIIDAFSARR